MMRSLVVLATLALIAPISAAEAGKEKKAKAAAEAPAAPAAEAVPAAAPSDTMAQSETPAPSAPPATDPKTEVFTPGSEKPSVAGKVKADWPKYDMGNKGHLTKMELSKWLSDLRTANGQPAPDANWLSAAFAQTDANSDKKVSPDELITSLSTAR